MRFAWWAAEEQGLVGSADYVAGLSPTERERIALYLNYDMVGSPNYIFMVYDADESTFEAPEAVTIPPGSMAIEDLYESYYTLVGEPYDDTAFDGRSDYEAFILAGIPSGGLFTGAEVPKTEEQEAIWGGTAGEQFDPCYHLACDTFDNVDLHALDVNSDLIAFAQLTFAYSTESVNGVAGKKVPGPPTALPGPAGPEGTFASPVTAARGLAFQPRSEAPLVRMGAVHATAPIKPSAGEEILGYRRRCRRCVRASGGEHRRRRATTARQPRQSRGEPWLRGTKLDGERGLPQLRRIDASAH